MLTAVSDALLDALAIVAPVGCAGCGAPDRALCADCRRALEPKPIARVLPDGTAVASGLPYDGIVRRVILALKEHGRTDVARALAPLLMAAVVAVAASAGGPVRLAPMPVSAVSYRRRGYDPMRVVLRAAGLGAPSPVLADALRRDEQKGLGRAARVENLAGTMRVRGNVRGWSLLLVDDVVTTGATLVEAARAIREAGGSVVGAATIAATPKLFELR